jgi:hypothetical protein
METKRNRRDAAINLMYWIALAALAIIVGWQWVFGGHYGHLPAAVCWSVLVIIALGLLNSLGLFGRR